MTSSGDRVKVLLFTENSPPKFKLSKKLGDLIGGKYNLNKAETSAAIWSVPSFCHTYGSASSC